MASTGASLMILGSALIITAYVLLTVPVLTSVKIALLAVCLIGIGFSLVPAALCYTLPMAIFVMLGVLALVFAVLLKAEDKKQEHGLELPNQKS